MNISKLLRVLLLQHLKSIFLYGALVLAFAIGAALRTIPFLESYFVQLVDTLSGIKMAREDYWDSLFSWQMLHTLWHALVLDMNKKVRVGASAYNPPLMSVDGKRRFRLLDYAQGERPLVVNFGSCSWLPFRTKLREFNEIVRDFVDVADFVLVYIEEAHPSDGWALQVSRTLDFFIYSLILSFVYLFIYLIIYLFIYFIHSPHCFHFSSTMLHRNSVLKRVLATLCSIITMTSLKSKHGIEW